MKNIILRRTFQSEKGTLGMFIIDGVPLFLSLELAIPIKAGEYQCEIYHSPTHGDVYLLKDVPDHTFVEIHEGNYIEDTKSCILIGRGFSMMAVDKLYVSESRISLDRFHKLMNKEPFNLIIEEKL